MDYGKLALKKIEELKDVIGDVNLSSLPRGGTVGLTAEDFIGVTRLSKSLDFYTNADGDLTLSMSGHLSGSALIIFLLDGAKIFSRSASTGWVSEKITLTMADKGEHSFKLLAAGGSGFDLTDIKMSAEGRIPALDGNYFLEAFPDGTGYIFRRFGTLEIFAQSGVSYVLIRSIGGVLYARTAGDDEKYIAAVTEKGVACLIDLASGYSSPGFYQICRGARAIAATEKEAGFLEIFVATEKELLHYRFNKSACQAELSGRLEMRCNDLAAMYIRDAVYLLCGNYGYCTLSRLKDAFPEATSDYFNFYTSREDT